jgi:hypothetical protein
VRAFTTDSSEAMVSLRSYPASRNLSMCPRIADDLSVGRQREPPHHRSRAGAARRSSRAVAAAQPSRRAERCEDVQVLIEPRAGIRYVHQREGCLRRDAGPALTTQRTRRSGLGIAARFAMRRRVRSAR